MAYCQRVWGHVGDVALHKSCTLLYYFVWLQRALVRSVFSSISFLLEEWAATATSHWLAQGWVNACNTRVERLLCLRSDCPKIHMIVRSFVIFRHAWTVMSWWSRAGGTCRSRYLVSWYQATVCSNRHRFSSFGRATITSDYSCSPNISYLL